MSHNFNTFLPIVNRLKLESSFFCGVAWQLLPLRTLTKRYDEPVMVKNGISKNTNLYVKDSHFRMEGLGNPIISSCFDYD